MLLRSPPALRSGGKAVSARLFIPYEGGRDFITPGIGGCLTQYNCDLLKGSKNSTVYLWMVELLLPLLC